MHCTICRLLTFKLKAKKAKMLSNFVISLCCFSAVYISIVSSTHPDPLLPNLAKHTGYIETNGASMFYYFFEKRSAPEGPVVLWLTGILGLSCSAALFHDNGPFQIIDTTTHGLRLQQTEYGWDKLANIIYVDQPIETGFSRSYGSFVRQEENHIVDDLYSFLLGFFQKYWNFQHNDFFIVGQSYAGKYAPALARKIYSEKAMGKNFINLAGVAIGNGMTNPQKLFATLPEFAKEMGLIENKDSDSIKEKSEECQTYANACERRGGLDCLKAYGSCHTLLDEIVTPTLNIYNIKRAKVTDLNYDFTNVERFLDDKLVKSALRVQNPNRQFKVYKPHRLYELMMRNHYMKNAEGNVAFLLDKGISVLVYGGEYDLQCNYIGNLKWVEELKWTGSTGFKEYERFPFKVDGAESGDLREYENLAFVNVFKAGQMVGMDQPKVAFQMRERWMKDARDYKRKHKT